MPRNSAARDARKAKTAENQRRALELRRQGLAYYQIGEEMGFTQKYAWDLVRTAIADIPKELAKEVRTIEMERLDRDWRRIEDAHARIESKVKAGDLKAIATMVRLQDASRSIQERRAKYLKLDAPTRAEISGPNGEPLHAVDFGSLSEDQLRAIARGDLTALTSAGAARAPEANQGRGRAEDDD